MLNDDEVETMINNLCFFCKNNCFGLCECYEIVNCYKTECELYEIDKYFKFLEEDSNVE